MSIPAGRILVVDDEPQIHRFLNPALTASGYESVRADRGDEALRLAASRAPDAILLDLGLPDMDGHEVLAKLREFTDVPVIILSARDRETEKIAALDAGADDYIEKPFGLGELLARIRTALLSSLSHDLRTPLTAIRGAAETLASAGDALDEATRADLLASITQDTGRMTKFLANIMEMARVDTGEITAKRERVHLAEIIEAAISRVSGALSTGVHIADSAAYAIADPNLLEQVIVNVLDNAVKYAPEGSRISVTALRDGAKVSLSVADEGVGIPPDELSSVFDSFFRATRGDRVAPGTGLGLAIAKAFTEAMGGSIRAQSPRLDLPADGLPGTSITIELQAA